MATASAAIAEVYMTKRTYEEKMKKMEKMEAAAGKKEADQASTTTARKSKDSSSGGFFSGRIFKKVHSSADVPSSETTAQ